MKKFTSGLMLLLRGEIAVECDHVHSGQGFWESATAKNRIEASVTEEDSMYALQQNNGEAGGICIVGNHRVRSGTFDEMAQTRVDEKSD